MFIIALLVILVLGFWKDFRRDQGYHTKAKIIHVICLSLLYLLFSTGFRSLGWLMKNFGLARERFAVSVGFIPGEVHFIIYLVNVCLVLVIFFLLSNMLRRREIARQRFIYLLPAYALTETFKFYIKWASEGDLTKSGDFIIISLGLALFGGITTAIIALYSTEFMRSFFRAQQDLNKRHFENEIGIKESTGSNT